MIGLYFKGRFENYQMHIGQLKYTSGQNLTPMLPPVSPLTRPMIRTMVVSWDLGDYDTVKQYNVYAVINGVEQYMGGIYDEIYYIKDVYDAQGEVTIKVTAVGRWQRVWRPPPPPIITPKPSPIWLWKLPTAPSR